MIIYLLRHEKRFPIPTFFTTLTTEGHDNTQALSEKINIINPDIIISSPFLRCIQTIYPYAITYKKKVNIDYALYEFLEDPLFTKNNYKHDHSELYEKYPDCKNIINEEYQPYITIDHITFPEHTFGELNKRLLPFIKYLQKTYSRTNIKILIVSHMSVISSIKEYIKTGQPSTRDIYYPMGHIEKMTL